MSDPGPQSSLPEIERKKEEIEAKNAAINEKNVGLAGNPDLSRLIVADDGLWV